MGAVDRFLDQADHVILGPDSPRSAKERDELAGHFPGMTRRAERLSPGLREHLTNSWQVHETNGTEDRYLADR